MRQRTRRVTRLAATAVLTGSIVTTAGAGVALADSWPTPPPYPTPTAPYETADFLTPADPGYWNPFVSADRLTSPFGTSTKIVCESFHGVKLDCWQADLQGNPHKLVQLPLDFPGSTGAGLPGGGPGHFVYPFWSAPSA
ncbi:hypothetical protein [Speluncibacter jeojiensis]|uniref:hypothetical protein n=1 Tax=Speluncibacter jeojiensis TaxID=2710754 RepID=UPI002410044F|nr:hypothetical protein [Rhodococcus sp. D2-41]